MRLGEGTECIGRGGRSVKGARSVCLKNNPQNERGWELLQTFKMLAIRGFQITLTFNPRNVKHMPRMGLYSIFGIW